MKRTPGGCTCGYGPHKANHPNCAANRQESAELVEAVAAAIWSEYVYGDSKSKYRQALAVLAVEPIAEAIADAASLRQANR